MVHMPESWTVFNKAHTDQREKSHHEEQTDDTIFPHHQFLLRGRYQVTQFLWKHFCEVVVYAAKICNYLRVLLISGYISPAPF